MECFRVNIAKIHAKSLQLQVLEQCFRFFATPFNEEAMTIKDTLNRSSASVHSYSAFVSFFGIFFCRFLMWVWSGYKKGANRVAYDSSKHDKRSSVLLWM